MEGMKNAALPGEQVTQAEFARRVGCSRQNISKLVKAGKLTINAAGKLDLVRALAEYDANTDPAHHERLKKTADSAGEPELPTVFDAPAADDETGQLPLSTESTFKQARTEREQHNAQLARLKYQEKTGELISASQVERDAFEMSRALRDGFQAITERLAPILAAEQDERRVADILREEINKTLHGVADIGKKLMASNNR